MKDVLVRKRNLVIARERTIIHRSDVHPVGVEKVLDAEIVSNGSLGGLGVD